MGLDFGIITGIIEDQGNWCLIAMFLFFLWLVTFFLLIYRIELCKKLKQELGYAEKKDKTSKKV